MLFLTVPGGSASLQRGLFMGNPGMYIRGFVMGGVIRKSVLDLGLRLELRLDWDVFMYEFLDEDEGCTGYIPSCSEATVLFFLDL